MSSTDQRETIGVFANWLHSRPRRYGFAVVAVIAAALVRYVLDVALGVTPPYILFYPTIMLIALISGLGPGVSATLLSAAIAEYFYLEPLNSIAIRNRRDIVGLVLFGVMGVAISWVSDLFRRRAKRLQEFEKSVEGLEEMIVVLDRDYRYVIANRTFLNYRGLKREDVVGHRIQELLTPTVFETTVKKKLDECFQGKTVRYELRDTYPSLGERILFVSYFPIESQGGVDRVVIVMRDVTDQKEAERSLKLFRTLIDQSNDAVEVIDPKTLRFLDINGKPARIWAIRVKSCCQ
jgi:PAS domain S-box-containing protein